MRFSKSRFRRFVAKQRAGEKKRWARSLARKQVKWRRVVYKASRAKAGIKTDMADRWVAMQFRVAETRFKALMRVMLYRTYMGLGPVSRIALADIMMEHLNPFWGPALKGRKIMLESIKLLVAAGKLERVGNRVFLKKKNGSLRTGILSLCRVENANLMKTAA